MTLGTYTHLTNYKEDKSIDALNGYLGNRGNLGGCGPSTKLLAGRVTLLAEIRG